ncbi:hypothetical protein CUR178_02498 [Leishmania enriettii]|uniref:Uncharacterized protein n=1 Tax=Leishmania enriettii TaxID=5663 RepID=A0A836KFV7_LEIEN|nr:hypothetical protein CUR178_02498 [Leishmania enriettii]
MLTLTRRVVGHRAKQHLPRSLQGLSAPNVRRGWGNMKSLSSKEKRELLRGAWREATPIQLVPDPSSRDRDAASEPLTFATDEAADGYLAEEEKGEAEEMRESTLALARRFFVELAVAAGEELDGAQMPPPPQSDEERRREVRDVQREFFGDFYVEQGIIDEAERYAFVDAMLRPSRPLFLVNSVLPLARLTVRDQLEAHQTAFTNLDGGIASGNTTGFAGTPCPLPVFTPTPFDPCMYAVPLPPTQAFGAPLHIRFSAATSRLRPPVPHGDASAQAIDSECASSIPLLDERPCTTGDQTALPTDSAAADFIADAEVLSLMLNAPPYTEGDSSHLPVAGQSASLTKSTRELAAASDEVAASSLSVADATPRPRAQPPSLAHMYWLQRQVASNTVLHVDDVSVAVSILSVWLTAAAIPVGDGASQPYEVLLCQANDRDETACAYHTEIAQYLFRAAQADSSDLALAGRLARVVIAVEDVSLKRSTSTSRHQVTGNRECSRPPRRQAPLASLLCDESTVAVMDRCPNLVYLRPPSPHTRGQPCKPRHGSVMDGGAAVAALHPLSRVVLCMPATSRDGVRPRGWLTGGEEETSEEAADLTPFGEGALSLPRRGASSSTAEAPPNNFVERCRRASVNFVKLQKQLYAAIQSVRADGCGWVIYATQSANVIENEAVVCAVLQRIRMEGERATLELPRESCGAAANDVSAAARQVRRSLSVECVSLNSPTIEACVASPEAISVLRLLCSEGRPGVSTWVAIKDGSPLQEAEQYSEELRTSVAQAAWRTEPMRTGSDGGFVVCLRVTSAAQVREHPHSESVGAAANPLPLTCCWWTHPDSHVLSGVTPAALQFLHDVERGAAGGATTILHAGVPVGLVSTSPAAPASDSHVTAAVPALPADCRISSATCHVDVLGTLRRLLPYLPCSAKALCELLLLKQVQSHTLRRQLRLRRRHSTGPSGQSLDVNVSASDIEAETRAFLAAVEKAAEHHLLSAASPAKLSNRFYLWVGVAAESLLPSFEGSSISGATESVEARLATGLHPAVLAEVEAAGVVAEVEYVRHPSPRESASSFIDFTVRLDVPPDMPERSKHVAALEEWRVALRDALLYVLRRTCKDSGSVRLWWKPSMNSVDVCKPRAGGDDGCGAPSAPRWGKVLELTEDEYETVHTLQDLQARGVAHPHAVRDCPALPSTEAEDHRADWLRETNYQEWRRRRAEQSTRR